jgi:hypothetical protein
MSQTHEHGAHAPSKQPGTSANPRSWSWRSANWPSRRAVPPPGPPRFSECAETIGPFHGSKVVDKTWTDGGPTHDPGHVFLVAPIAWDTLRGYTRNVLAPQDRRTKGPRMGLAQRLVVGQGFPIIETGDASLLRYVTAQRTAGR